MIDTNELDYQKDAIEQELAITSMISRSSLVNQIENLKCPLDNYDLTVIVPPYPCSACVVSQEDIFAEYYSEQQTKTLFVVPQYRERDVKARLSEFQGIDYFTYDVESLDSEDFKRVEGLVYLRSSGYRNPKYEVFLSNKWFPKVTNSFLYEEN